MAWKEERVVRLHGGKRGPCSCMERTDQAVSEADIPAQAGKSGLREGRAEAVHEENCDV